MTYSPAHTKTKEDLAAELRQVFDAYPEYSDPILGLGNFEAMVQKFAVDDFFKLHLVARAYLGLPFQTPYVGQRVRDLTGDFSSGRILDIYENRMCGPVPVTMLMVDFGDDQVFDRLPSEVAPAGNA